LKVEKKGRDARKIGRVDKHASYGRSERYFVLGVVGEASLC
jgi:hypothetical protein